ncbi:MAG: peptidoglycan D,D-transpeptidase FtsI family protein [Actinomycetota bacterium]
MARLHHRRDFVAFLLAGLTFASCTGGGDGSAAEESADPAVAATAFIDAWNGLDEEGLNTVATSTTEVAAFLKAMSKAETQGLITEHAAALGDPLEDTEPTPGTAVEVPYSIEWSSDASTSPVALDGSLELTYDDDDTWSVAVSKDLLWPGIERAARFKVATEWRRRGRILDRAKRPLAKGAVDDRTYPQGPVAGATVGHIGVLTKKDVRQGAEGVAGDLVGASGLEEAFQDELAGEPTMKLLVVDRTGRTLERLGTAHGTRGTDVRTTLDIDVQRAAEAAYGSTVGGAMVIAPDTGDLLAVVSSSAFDPNNYVGVADIEPFNRALSGLYPPGSAMKVVTAAAALDTGTVTPNSNVTGPKEYQGVRNFESGEFGTIDFATAVKFSVNTAFAQVAEDLGARKMSRYAEAFGFNEPPAMALGAATSSFPFPEDLSDLMWGSVGQAQVVATPLQMATVAATIANGGRRMEPRIDRSVDPVGERAIKKKTASTMAGLMETVVEGGTGTGARISGVRVAGKTGTAEVDVGGERKNHAWFVCFAPVGDPKVAVAVVSEYGGVGGQVAAPLARQILVNVLPVVK